MENWGAAELRALFGGSADVAERQIMAGGQKLDVLFLDGLTSGGDIAEQVLRPLMQTVQPGSMQAVLAQAEQARVYCAVAERVTAPEDAADKLLHGYCVVVFPGTGAALCFETKTDTRRGPSAPESENTVKGARTPLPRPCASTQASCAAICARRSCASCRRPWGFAARRPSRSASLRI